MTIAGSTKVSSALLLAVVLSLLGVVSAAHAAAPAWSLHMDHSLASFNRLDRGDQYTVRVENSGDEATSGTYVLDDTLPPQLNVVSVTEGDGWTCTTTGQVIAGTPLSCSRGQTLAPGTSALAVTVGVDVPASAPDTVSNAATISGGGAAAASATDPTPVIDRPRFGVQTFTTRTADGAAAEYTVAGGHPYQAVTSFTVPLYRAAGAESAVEEIKESSVELAPGLLSNPAAATRCPLAKLSGVLPLCPASSKVGVIDLGVKGIVNPLPLYNVIPERGYPAEFAFKFGTFAVTLYGTFRPRTKSYGVTIGVPGITQLGITSIGVTLFGVPSARNGAGGAPVPLLANPVNCLEPRTVTKIAIDSWQQPGRTLLGGSPDLKIPDLSDPNWKTAIWAAPGVSGCASPALASQFRPHVDARIIQPGAALQADQPAGLAVALDFPQSNDPTDPTTSFDPAVPQAPELKDAVVKLPAGLAISPSAADGLGACSDRAEDPAGDGVRLDNTIPVSCPDAAKIGTVTATSPLLAAHSPADDAITGPEPLDGDIYLVKPHPGDLSLGDTRDGTFRALIQLRSERYGVVIKLPATIRADATTGRLTATVEESPQLPLSHLELHMKSGPRAPLATPVTCGTFTASTVLVPWSSPETADATPSASFAVTAGPNGSACAATARERPFSPVLGAGAESARAGAASPFVLKLTRDDGEQELSSLEISMPSGSTAKLAGIPYCSAVDIASAAAKSGAAEQASPSCPSASQIGSLSTAAGPGSNPYHLPGKAYLAGPYKGAPLSFAFITPALAGPFDLGSVVVRSPALVDQKTARVTIKTDPLPQILGGVPLRTRSIAIRLDRPGFTRNPTSCEAKSVSASVVGSSGGRASPSNYFQVGDCARLGFKPKLALRLIGPTHRSAHPKLRATLMPRPGDSNIDRATLTLPKTELLENAHVQTICTRARYAAQDCPARSIYGYAKAWTPLLDKPLKGPVYLRSSSHRLPDLVAALDGQIHVDMAGHIDSVKARIRARFDTVPDVPLSRFVLTMQGGRKGLLVNNIELCRAKPRADALFKGQNGRRRFIHPLVKADCGKKN